MRKTTWLVGTCVIGAIVVVCLRMAANPMRRSESEILAMVQAQTPLGGSYRDTFENIKKAKWDDPAAKGFFGETKAQSIQGKLGEYQGFPFVTSVFASWEFDSDSRLREIKISKISDAL